MTNKTSEFIRRVEAGVETESRRIPGKRDGHAPQVCRGKLDAFTLPLQKKGALVNRNGFNKKKKKKKKKKNYSPAKKAQGFIGVILTYFCYILILLYMRISVISSPNSIPLSPFRRITPIIFS